MTDVVFDTPSGDIDPDLVVLFSMTKEPTNVSIKYIPAVGAGSWDVVYGKTDFSRANGVFSDRWSALASRSGNDWTINPPVGGWPCRFQVVVDPASGSSGIIGGDLSPTLSPTAWYVLDPTRRTVDQSGNSHTLSGSGSEVSGPSLGLVASTLLGLSETNAVWRTNGAISVVALVNIAGSAGDRWFASCELGGGRNTWWKFGLSSNGKPFYGVDNHTANTGEGVEWGPVLPTTGWHTFGFTRAANGLALKAYLDGVLVGSTNANIFPEGGASAILTIGKDLFAAVQAYNQQCTALWTTELDESDMLFLAQRLQGV